MTIKDITDKFEIKIIAPDGHSLEKEVALEPNGTILFNLKPLLHLNVIHFSLFCYLKAFSNAGFKCTIILLDLIIANGDYTNEIKNQKEANKAMDWLYKQIEKFVGNLDNIEIIPESGLHHLYNREKTYNNDKNDFFCDLIKLSSIADKEVEYSENNIFFDQISSLCCLLYEGYLCPNYVITADPESKTLWTKLREKGRLNIIFGKDYNPPIMLALPSIYMYDSKELVSTLEKRDPFSQFFTLSNRSALEKHYAAKIRLLNKEIMIADSDDPKAIIDEFRKKMYN